MKTILAISFCLIVIVMSLIAFVLYAIDKVKAKRGAWRIPEAVLLGWGFFGGAIGALCAMKMLRHKTKHWYFWVVNIAGLVLHIAILTAVITIL
jgi:uncharacterized membrane protein YsdA (DUF1294 family)